MFDWINQHHYTISALTNVGMLLVWVAYLQLFLFSYRRQRRAEIVIDAGAGNGLKMRCLVSNMSVEAIYVTSVVLTLRENGGEFRCPATEVQDLDDEQHSSDPQHATRQGPLAAGSYMDLGTFQSLLDRVRREAERDRALVQPEGDRNVGELEVQIIGSYASEDHLVAAARKYVIARENEVVTVRPRSIRTKQIRSRRGRKRLETLLRNQL